MAVLVVFSHGCVLTNVNNPNNLYILKNHKYPALIRLSFNNLRGLRAERTSLWKRIVRWFGSVRSYFSEFVGATSGAGPTQIISES